MATKQTTFPTLGRIRVTGDTSFRPEQNRGKASIRLETTFPTIESVPISTEGTATGFATQFVGDVYSNRGRFGNGTTFLEITAEHIQSSNFVTGSAGWQMTYDGDLEASSGTFRGDISAATGTIGGFTIGSTTLTGGTTNIILDSSNKAISINSATFGNSGIQLQYNAGTPRFYVGDGSNTFIQYNGTTTTVRGDLKLDSLQYNKHTILPVFESLDAWNPTLVGNGSASNIEIGVCQLITGDTVGNISKIYIATMVRNLGYDLNPLFQSTIDFSSAPENQDVIIGLGSATPFSPTDFFGFRWDKTDNKMYAISTVSSSETKTQIVGYDTGIENTVRAEMTDNGDNIKYYVNEVLKTTYTSAGNTIDSDILFAFANRNDDGGGALNLEAYIRNIIFSQDN